LKNWGWSSLKRCPRSSQLRAISLYPTWVSQDWTLNCCWTMSLSSLIRRQPSSSAKTWERPFSSMWRVPNNSYIWYICRRMKHLDVYLVQILTYLTLRFLHIFIQQMQALIHVSTAYNNLDKNRIEELIYPTSISSTRLLHIVDLLDDESLQKITDQYFLNRFSFFFIILFINFFLI